MKKKPKIILSIIQESGLAEEQEVKPSPYYETTITKDYKKNLQTTQVDIELKPMDFSKPTINEQT